MTNMNGKIELCGELFPEEKVWEAYCNICEANTSFLFPYKDVEDLVEGMTKQEENILYEYFLRH